MDTLKDIKTYKRIAEKCDKLEKVQNEKEKAKTENQKTKETD